MKKIVVSLTIMGMAVLLPFDISAALISLFFGSIVVVLGFHGHWPHH